MATQMFEGRGHAAVYQKYRFSPGEELQGAILGYLREKGTKPTELAVDVGCGSGQGTRFLAERFGKVVGTDISQAQIQEAKAAPSPPNVSYLVCPAEELPFEDASVDLLASFTAAHWFDIEKFMREVNRVVRPGGCVAISTYTVDMSLHYGTCSEKLTQIFRENHRHLRQNSHDGCWCGWVLRVCFSLPSLHEERPRSCKNPPPGDGKEVAGGDGDPLA
nr:putative methyltransferase DDB_G0268948 isoform X2 [Anser cygnoides]